MLTGKDNHDSSRASFLAWQRWRPSSILQSNLEKRSTVPGQIFSQLPLAAVTINNNLKPCKNWLFPLYFFFRSNCGKKRCSSSVIQVFILKQLVEIVAVFPVQEFVPFSLSIWFPASSWLFLSAHRSSDFTLVIRTCSSFLLTFKKLLQCHWWTTVIPESLLPAVSSLRYPFPILFRMQ